MNQPRTDKEGRIIRPNEAAQPPAENGEKKLSNDLSKILTAPWFMKEIERALPRGLDAARMLRVSMTALRQTKNLRLCTPESFLGCVLQSSQLGLEVNTPLQLAYLIPRRNAKLAKALGVPEIWECTLLVGYQGMITLSDRSGRIEYVMAQAVREGDFFEYEYGSNEHLRWKPSREEGREGRFLTDAWAQAKMKSGGKPFVVLSRDQLEGRRARSGSPNDGPWMTDFEAMCQKTALRALWKFLPKSADVPAEAAIASVERLETAVELGRSQTNAFSDDIREALLSNGIQPTDEVDDESTSQPTTETADASAKT